jgi:anti-sigma factor RsiW
MKQIQDRATECELCEAMCPDAVDGTLSEAERKVFERHVAGCVACAKELEEAQRGAAWLGMLKGHTPEPPAALLAKILSGTTGAQAAASRAAQGVASEPENVPAWVRPVPVREAAPVWALSSVWRRVTEGFRIDPRRPTFQPQMAMTAAMAFFSLALTVNLTGVHLRDVKASDFTPSGIRRSMANATASAARNFENLRVVYQVESRVSELRGDGPLADQMRPEAATQSQPAKQPEGRRGQ